MPKIKINDINMYYEVHGKGEPLVLIGGFSVDHLAWALVFEKLAEHYQVIVLDNRGSGQTDVPAENYSIEQMAQDVVDLCEKLDVKQAHIVGHSMGGFIAQMLAYRHSNFVKSVTISNSAMMAHSTYAIYLDAQLALLRTEAPLEAMVTASCAWVFSYKFLSQPGQLKVLIDLRLNNPYPFTVIGFEGQKAALNGFDSRSWIDQIKVPTFIIAADQDIVLPARLSHHLSEKMPQADYYCFENCAHVPQVEYPDLFIDVLKQFHQKLKK